MNAKILFCISLFTVFYLAKSQAQSCDYVAGTINFTASGGTGNTDDYDDIYLLVDANTDTIVQVSTVNTTSFDNVVAGTYDIYNVNYETTLTGGLGTSVTGLTVGNNVTTDIGGSCYALSSPLADVEVCDITIQWTNATASGSESFTSYQPTLTISGGDLTNVSMATTIQMEYTGGTATHATDYSSGSTNTTLTLTIPKEDFSSGGTKNLNDLIAGTADDLSIVDDDLYESDETIEMTLSSPTGLTLGATTVHTYTIEDDDQITVAFSNATSSDNESEASPTYPSLVVTGGQITSNATVEITLTGTATEGADFNPNATTITVTIPSGNYKTTPLTQIINDFTLSTADLAIVDDVLQEDDETIILTLGSPSGVTIGAEDEHTYTILDDDTLVVQFSNSAASGSEAVTALTVPSLVVSGAQISSAATVQVSFNGSSTAVGGGSDYNLSTTITVTIPAADYSGGNSLTQSLNDFTLSTADLAVVDDAVFELDETIVMDLVNGVDVTLGTTTQFTYTIQDDDCGAGAATTISTN